MIIVASVQVINTRLDVLFCVGNGGVKLEQAAVADQAVAVQLFNDIVHGIGLVYGDGHHLILPAEGQYIGSTHPQHPSGGDADGKNQGQPDKGDQNVGNSQQTFPLFPLGTALSHGTLTVLRFRLFGLRIRHGVKVLAVIPVFLVGRIRFIR